MPSKPASKPKGVVISEALLADVKAILGKLEFGKGGDAGGSHCPECNARQPLDPANVRDFETHAPDCQVGATVAAVNALAPEAEAPAE